MLIYSTLILLLSNAVTIRRDKSILFNRVAIINLLYSIVLGILSSYIFSLDKGISIYAGLFNVTNITQIFQIFVFIISAIILLLTGFYPRKIILKEYSILKKILPYNYSFYKTKIINKMGEQYKIIEYPLILLFIIIGGVFLISSSDLISIFLSIELQSYGLYLLSTLYRNSELATSAGITYFLLGGLSSCFILQGTSLLYANSGVTNLESIYIITSLTDISYKEYNEDNISNLYEYNFQYINISLLILSVGFLFKVSAAPFHFWAPNVYDAIPTIVTTFVAIVGKISIFIFLLELVHYTSFSNFILTSKFGSGSWINALLISSLISLIIGTIVGLTQFRIKRLFAYSTISHIGFILLALSINSIESIQAFLFYLMQYSLSNLNAFILLLSIGYSLYFYVNDNKEYKGIQDKDNSPIQLISQIKGLFFINPVLAISLAITIFSFVGIPPLIGFFAKQMVLSAALDNGYIFISMVAILTSVISAVYYLNLIKEVFFKTPEYKVNSVVAQYLQLENTVGGTPDVIIKHNNKLSPLKKFNIKYNNIILSSSVTISISVITLAILFFIIMPQEWLSLTNILALIIFNT
jgi:NADH-ubiquinone oxidoreductase chain 2